jgi:CheY-like chemotaxis protein
MVLEVAKAALEQFGYRVSAYLSSAELLADVLREGFRGDILITDQTMPHMSGVELAQKVIALTPDVPVILCSGYDLTGDGSIAEGVVSAHVSKPYSILDLLKVIRSLLDKRNVHSRKVAQAG